MNDINLNAYKPETSGENREKESEKLLDACAHLSVSTMTAQGIS